MYTNKTEKERYDEVLSRYGELMIEKMKEVEAGDWEQPWINPKFTAPAESYQGRPYRGSNQLLLSFLTETKQYQVPVYATFKRCNDMGVRIKKGEKGFPIINYNIYYYNTITSEKISEDKFNALDKEKQADWKKSVYFKPYTVFNLDQTDFAEKHPEEWERIQERFTTEIHAQGEDYINPLLDRVIKENNWVCPINIKESDSAFYSPSKDTITLPRFDQFPNKKDFYFTALHEMTHSTGAEGRCNRKFGLFGDKVYAREELVAEFTSSFIGSRLGMSVIPRKENAQYLKSWMSAITNDTDFLNSILKDVNKASTLMESVINEKNIVTQKEDVSEEKISDIHFSKDKDGIIYVEGKLSSGSEFKGLVYKRGNEYSFSTGSIADKNFTAYILDDKQTAEVEALINSKDKTNFVELTSFGDSGCPKILGYLGDKDNLLIRVELESGIAKDIPFENVDGKHTFTMVDQNTKEATTYSLTDDMCMELDKLSKTDKSFSNDANYPDKIVAKTARKTITITKDSAVITYAGKEYNATPVIEKLRSNNIEPMSISEDSWQKMLKGQGIQLGQNKGMFSICKTPAGYGMKVISIVNTKVNEVSSEM